MTLRFQQLRNEIYCQIYPVVMSSITKLLVAIFKLKAVALKCFEKQVLFKWERVFKKHL